MENLGARNLKCGKFNRKNFKMWKIRRKECKNKIPNPNKPTKEMPTTKN
jgi:hypothetical protein